MRRVHLTLFLTVLYAAGCQGPVPLANTDAPDLSRTVGGLEVGNVWYACGRWSELGRPTGSVLVDIVFGSNFDDANVGPTAENIQTVTDEGGNVLGTFNLAAVRAEVDAQVIERMSNPSRPGRPNAVYAVPEGATQNFVILVGFRSGHGDAVAADIARFGGTALQIFNNVRSISAVLPDSMLTAIAVADGVEYVTGPHVSCTN